MDESPDSDDIQHLQSIQYANGILLYFNEFTTIPSSTAQYCESFQ
jgi:hypothetical protein